jgi:hypothetical protein
MNDEIWKDFFIDYQTQQALNSSEVWRNYVNAELAREELRTKNAVSKNLETENILLDEIENFRQHVEANPVLKNMFKKASDILKQYPDLKNRVDPNFIKGLELLDLED